MASGDPRPDGVILWTRLSHDSREPAPVAWTVGRDPALTDVAATGETVADPGADSTVKVLVEGLEPATTYWYRFSAGGRQSRVGRTRTAAAPGAGDGRLRLGLVCCSNWATGFFNAYRGLAARDVDLVVHLGDYIYEQDPRKSPSVRLNRPAGRMVDLAGYRARHAQYKTDPDLAALHAAHPVVAVWDDHELAGNAWRNGSPGHDPRHDGHWETRLAAAVRAYVEWMPVPAFADSPVTLWRRLELGGLADLLVLDTRVAGRDRPAAGRRPVLRAWRSGRSLLGDDQRRWLAGELSRPQPPRWRLLASQVVVSPVRALHALGGVGINSGQWDGYPDERDRLVGWLAARPGETVVLSGDLHSSFAARVDDRHGRAVAAEATVPAVSAPTFARSVGMRSVPWLLERLIRSQNPHVSWVDTSRHGYAVLDVTADRLVAEWWHVERSDRRDPGERLAAQAVLHHGDPRWRDLY